jgi:peptidoglycan/xylan/chitin deacetylase (PgdA/CDA1 family)
MRLKRFIGHTALILVIACGVLVSFSVYAKGQGVPVLGYHSIVEDKDKDRYFSNYIYAEKKSQFEKQIKYLYENHYKTLTMAQLYDYLVHHKVMKGRCVVLTFDDGFENFNTIVKPILEKYHMQATAFVIGKHLKDHVKPGFLTESEIKNDETAQYYSHSYDMHAKSPHGFDRKKIQDMTLKQIDEDFKKPGADHTYFAYPYGRVRPGMHKILKENHVKMAFKYNQFHNASSSDDIYALPRYMVVSVTPMALFRWMVG